MALKHEYFQESPVPVDPSMFPTWPAKSEQPRRTHGNSPKPPSGGKAFSKLLVSMMYLKAFENNTVFPTSIQTHVQLILKRICSKSRFQNSLTLPVYQRYRKKHDMLTDFNSCIILNLRVMMIMLRRVVEDFTWERQLKEPQQLVQDLPSSLAHRISLVGCQVVPRKAGDTNSSQMYPLFFLFFACKRNCVMNCFKRIILPILPRRKFQIAKFVHQ